MRIPVFARGTNPSVDRWIQKKSKGYVAAEVKAGRAAWIDESDPCKGVICLEMLYFGEREFKPTPMRIASLPPIEVNGSRCVMPYLSITQRQERSLRLQQAAFFNIFRIDKELQRIAV